MTDYSLLYRMKYSKVVISCQWFSKTIRTAKWGLSCFPVGQWMSLGRNLNNSACANCDKEYIWRLLQKGMLCLWIEIEEK